MERRKNGMRINPDILRGEEARPAVEIVNLMKEEPEKLYPADAVLAPRFMTATSSWRVSKR